MHIALPPYMYGAKAAAYRSQSASGKRTRSILAIELFYVLNTDNVYNEVGNRVYRQRIGIPMGTDCAPLLANLFLFHYEYNMMKASSRQILI